MAMESGSVSKQGVSEKKERVKSSVKKDKSKVQENGVSTSPAKRNNKPNEIRVVGGRIYDSVNGKTCHQCRQKTRDFVVACTSQRNNKPCTIMYCHKCLLNRYGEKAEEVAALGEWSCPKCRGICNCSVCMKKRGHLPTGILINTAKATGFSSVSEMLLKGAERLNQEKDVADSPKKEVISSPVKRGKENSFDGNVDVNSPNHVDKKSKKIKKGEKGSIEDDTSLNLISRSPDKGKLKQKKNVHESTKKLGTEEIGSRGSEKKAKKKKRDRSDEVNTEKNDEKTMKETSVRDDEKKLKKPKKDESKNDDSKKNDATLARRTSPRKLKVSNNVPNEEAKLDIGVDPDKSINDKIMTQKPLVSLENGGGKGKNGNTAISGKHQSANFHVEIPLPVGIELDSVAGIDVRTEDAGNALQFLEFCAVFGKILEVKKGQAEHVLQDLLHGRTGRRGKFSLTVQFHIHLLSIILSEQREECVKLSPSYGKDSWFNALKECLSECQNVLKAHGLDCLDKAADYETLEASEKLRLLNLLCDEVLGTEKLRNWMDDENAKHAEKLKEAKKKVSSAKDKEKSLKQKMKDDIAKAIIARHGAPLSISEHEAIVSNIKRETAQAHAKVLESKGMLLKNNQKSDAVRIEPIFVGVGGHVYWKFKCIGKSDVLHQNAGEGDKLTSDDKWFIIDDQGKEAIDKLICSSSR